jgi:hypothetical protein
MVMNTKFDNLNLAKEDSGSVDTEKLLRRLANQKAAPLMVEVD